MGGGGGGRGDEDESGNPPVPVPSPDSIKSLAKYASKKEKDAELEAEAEDKFRNMRVGGGLDETSDDDEVGRRARPIIARVEKINRARPRPLTRACDPRTHASPSNADVHQCASRRVLFVALYAQVSDDDEDDQDDDYRVFGRMTMKAQSEAGRARGRGTVTRHKHEAQLYFFHFLTRLSTLPNSTSVAVFETRYLCYTTDVNCQYP